MGSGLWGHKQSYTTEHIHVSSSLDGGGSVLRNPSASCPLNCLQLVQKLLLGPRGSQLSGFSFLPWKTASLPQAITSPLMSNYTLLTSEAQTCTRRSSGGGKLQSPQGKQIRLDVWKSQETARRVDFKEDSRNTLNIIGLGKKNRTRQDLVLVLKDFSPCT